MKLETSERKAERKCENKQLRRAGKIPAVVYGASEPKNITIERSAFEGALRAIDKGCLPTTIFTLIVDGKEVKAIVKDIQYHVTTYDILHLDFQELQDKVAVNVNVPIHVQGADECPGVKLGGTMRQTIRHVRVNCLPGDIPANLPIDASDMELLGSKRLTAITFPEGVRPLLDLETVAVIIAKR